MSASIKSLKGVGKITHLPTCGGDKKQGLVPTACYGNGLLNNQNSGRTTIGYSLGLKTCPLTWSKYRVVGLTTRINSTVKIA